MRESVMPERKVDRKWRSRWTLVLSARVPRAGVEGATASHARQDVARATRSKEHINDQKMQQSN